jgi:hypothetical protein
LARLTRFTCLLDSYGLLDHLNGDGFDYWSDRLFFSFVVGTGATISGFIFTAIELSALEAKIANWTRIETLAGAMLMGDAVSCK